MLTKLKGLFGPTLRIMTLAFLACFFIALPALAGEPVSMGQLISDAVKLGLSAKQLGFIGVASGVVFLLVEATKTDFLGRFFHKLSDRVQFILIGILSCLSVGLASIMAGSSWLDAIFAVISSSALAGLLHNIVSSDPTPPTA